MVKGRNIGAMGIKKDRFNRSFFMECRPLAVQCSLLWEHGEVAIGETKDNRTVPNNEEAGRPFVPVRGIGSPLVKGQGREGQGLYCQDVTVDRYAYAVKNPGCIEQDRVISNAGDKEHYTRDNAADDKLREEEPFAVNPAVEHLVKGESGTGE